MTSLKTRIAQRLSVASCLTAIFLLPPTWADAQTKKSKVNSAAYSSSTTTVKKSKLNSAIYSHPTSSVDFARHSPKPAAIDQGLGGAQSIVTTGAALSPAIPPQVDIAPVYIESDAPQLAETLQSQTIIITVGTNPGHGSAHTHAHPNGNAYLHANSNAAFQGGTVTTTTGTATGVTPTTGPTPPNSGGPAVPTAQSLTNTAPLAKPHHVTGQHPTYPSKQKPQAITQTTPQPMAIPNAVPNAVPQQAASQGPTMIPQAIPQATPQPMTIPNAVPNAVPQQAASQGPTMIPQAIPQATPQPMAIPNAVPHQATAQGPKPIPQAKPPAIPQPVTQGPPGLAVANNQVSFQIPAQGSNQSPSANRPNKPGPNNPGAKPPANAGGQTPPSQQQPPQQQGTDIFQLTASDVARFRLSPPQEVQPVSTNLNHTVIGIALPRFD
ncbi:hypothetical protein [Thalassospira profundimaris]|uniref:Uncharacterized protein n=1 Tax=Thalassospira profundimaris TaxID=502049 RepID=A0A367WR47_9PROT|nr:hypothetical protein [Thalassospira profundimaris]RCK43946.1 hypothetical protein TH30_16405 [Thalassospira profundimaris]